MVIIIVAIIVILVVLNVTRVIIVVIRILVMCNNIGKENGSYYSILGYVLGAIDHAHGCCVRQTLLPSFHLALSVPQNVTGVKRRVEVQRDSSSKAQVSRARSVRLADLLFSDMPKVPNRCLAFGHLCVL